MQNEHKQTGIEGRLNMTKGSDNSTGVLIDLHSSADVLNDSEKNDETT